VSDATPIALGVLGYSFRSWRVEDASDLRSQRICEKNGFVCEGLHRMSVIKAGCAIDTVVWAAYRDTWK
jgi:hypothetical protein